MFASFPRQVITTSLLTVQRSAKASPNATPRHPPFLHRAPHSGQCVSSPAVDAERTPLTPHYSPALKSAASTSSPWPRCCPLLQAATEGTSLQTARLWAGPPLIIPPRAHHRHQAPLRLLWWLSQPHVRPSTANFLPLDLRRHGRPSLVSPPSHQPPKWPQDLAVVLPASSPMPHHRQAACRTSPSPPIAIGHGSPVLGAWAASPGFGQPISWA
jgi:hypothetical protein